MRLAAALLASFPALTLSCTAPGPGPSGPGADVIEKLGAQAPMDLELRDEEGGKVVLRSLIDRPTVLSLAYFRCAGICTPLLMGLTAALNDLPLEPGKDFRVLTVSFDPRDTPAIAKQKRINYLREFKRPFPPEAWRFLTGPEAATRSLADSVGFGYQRRGGDYIHPGLVMILTAEGKVSRYMYGTSFLPADLQMALGEASRGLFRPTLSKVLRFCYTFDPESRGRVFRLNRVFGLLTLASAGGLLAWAGLGGRKRK